MRVAQARLQQEQLRGCSSCASRPPWPSNPRAKARECRARSKSAPTEENAVLQPLPPTPAGAGAPVRAASEQTPHQLRWPVHPLTEEQAAIVQAALPPPDSGTAAAARLAAPAEREVLPGVRQCWWLWNGRRVRYLRCGAQGPPVVCVHGFCASADHWQHSLPYLGEHGCRAFALDLLGESVGPAGRSRDR